jgi:hypothetical protein
VKHQAFVCDACSIPLRFPGDDCRRCRHAAIKRKRAGQRARLAEKIIRSPTA